MGTMLTVEWWRCLSGELAHAFPVRGKSSLCSYFGWEAARTLDMETRYRCRTCEERAVRG